MSQFVAALNAGNMRQIKTLVNSGANINGHDEHGWTPLIHACEQGEIRIVRFLLRNGARVNVRQTNGETPLMAASRHGYLHIVQELLKAGAYVNAHSKNSETALELAAGYKHPQVVRELLKAGAHPRHVRVRVSDPNIRNMIHTYRPAMIWRNKTRARTALRALSRVTRQLSQPFTPNLTHRIASETGLFRYTRTFKKKS